MCRTCWEFSDIPVDSMERPGASAAMVTVDDVRKERQQLTTKIMHAVREFELSTNCTLGDTIYLARQQVLGSTRDEIHAIEYEVHI